MRLRLVAAGTRMPGWVSDGYESYVRRLPRELSLELRQIPLGHRAKGSPRDRAIAAEGEKMLAAAKGHRIVCLEVTGRALSTPQLAARLRGWMNAGQPVAFLVGGPDGLSPDCLAAASFEWSLSPLTLPHGLVRVVVAEQVYRAWTVITGHPYHRE